MLRKNTHLRHPECILMCALLYLQWLTHLFEEMSRSTSTHVICVCLALCVWLSPLTAQSTTDQCSEDSDRQVVLMEQIILMMESTNDRQMALMEQMHSILTSVDRRMEEIKHVGDRQVASMVQMYSTMQSVEGRMEETKYVNDRQVALLQSIDRRMEESNEGNDTYMYSYGDS